MTAPTPRRALAIGVAISTLAHALAVIWLVKGDGVAGAQASGEGAAIVVDFDVEVAPEAPEAFEPAAEDELSAEAAEPVEPEVAAVAADDEADDEPAEGMALVDGEADAGAIAAGEADAGAIAAAEPDAGAIAADDPDAGAIAGADSDAGAIAAADSDAGAIAAAGTDAGPIAAANTDAGAGAIAAAGTDITPARDAGSAVASAASTGTSSAAPAWSRLAHDDHAPAGDHIAVALRFGRLRGTEWAEHTAAILAPMPDYRTLVGERDIAVADLFDVFWMSSSDPSDVGATNLAARSTLPRTRLRRFLDHPRAHVSWSSARGGALGTREPSPLVHPGDARVFLIPFDPWVLLADDDALGDLPDAEAGDLDRKRAPDDLLPTWVRGLERFATATAKTEDLILWASVTDLPPRLVIPSVATLPGPSRVIAALSLQDEGFFLQGTLSFASPARAAEFERALLAARTELSTSWKGRALLASLHARNALEKLSLRRRADQIAFSTSLSVADARAAMRLAADWSKRFFDPELRGKP